MQLTHIFHNFIKFLVNSYKNLKVYKILIRKHWKNWGFLLLLVYMREKEVLF